MKELASAEAVPRRGASPHGPSAGVPRLATVVRMDAHEWDERYAATSLVWSSGPNALFAQIVADLPAGRALDLACGEGRNALWLAERGWSVTAVDFSAVGVAKGRQLSQPRHVEVTWQVADVTSAELGSAEYDLVAVLYLHLTRAQSEAVLGRCARALAPGGTLVVIGHDRTNLTEGVGGPQDPDILHDPDELAGAVPTLRIERCERVRRPVDDAYAIDTLLVARAPEVPPQP
jgi:SAM-dependent methyltransferase